MQANPKTSEIILFPLNCLFHFTAGSSGVSGFKIDVWGKKFLRSYVWPLYIHISTYLYIYILNSVSIFNIKVRFRVSRYGENLKSHARSYVWQAWRENCLDLVILSLYQFLQLGSSRPFFHPFKLPQRLSAEDDARSTSK